MRTEQIRFFSGGCRLAGTLLLPDAGAAPVPGIVHGPGWLGLRDAGLYRPYHEALHGRRVRGPDPGLSRASATPRATPRSSIRWRQVADIRAGLTYLQTRDEIDGRRLGVFGSGGTGGGNAVYAAGLDDRVRATVSQVPVSDGRDWLKRMRREHEWLEFLDRLEADRRRYVVTGESELVPPREGIMVATPERKATTVKADVDDRVPARVALASADAILAYRPLDVVDRIAPRALMLIAVEGDAVTPEDHAVALYERAGGPKRLLLQTGTTHYAAYAQYRDIVNPLIVEWFTRYLAIGDIQVREAADDSGVTYLTRPQAVEDLSA